MTIHEQVALATEKVAHWNCKRDHATAMLTKWQSRLSALQAKSNGKPEQPTANRLPKIELVPGSQQLMPRAAVKSASDVAAAQAMARASALADMEESGEVVFLTDKPQPQPKAKKPKRKH